MDEDLLFSGNVAVQAQAGGGKHAKGSRRHCRRLLPSPPPATVQKTAYLPTKREYLNSYEETIFVLLA